MTNDADFQIFISYRRMGGDVYGRLIYELLSQKGYNVFLDKKSLNAGRYDKKLLEIIDNCDDVLFILSKNCLERCCDPNDWFRKELEHALNNSLNIIPVFLEDFELPDDNERLKYPESVTKLLNYNGITINVDYLESAIEKIENNLISKASTANILRSGKSRGLDKILTSRELMCEISSNDKAEILKNLMLHKHGSETGEMAYEFVRSTLRQTYNIRTKFRYGIEISNGFIFPDSIADSGKYLKLSESLDYTKKYIKDKPSGHFWISFITDLDSLDASLRKEEFLFSENLLIDKEELEALAVLTDDEKSEFVNNYMRIRLNINRNVLQPDKIIIDSSGIYVKYDNVDSLFEKNLIEFKLKFSIPHRRGASYFFVSINDPTYSPSISFSYPESEIDVKMLPFLNYSSNSADTKIFDGLRELTVEDEWIFPVGGVVFIIT